MRQAPTCLLIVASAVFVASAPAQELKGRVWTHDKLGVKLTIPDGYSTVPLQVDEQWIAAKFLSDKTYLSKDRDWNQEHRPLMRVIVFTEKAKKASAGEVHEEEDGSTFIGIGAVPYQGYRDYVKRHRRGFFFSKEKEDKVGTESCLMCEVDVHKSDPKLHLYTVVCRRPTFEIAVEFEVLEDRRDQLEKYCLRALESIRFSEPALESGAAETGGRRTSTRVWTAFRSQWRKRPHEERVDIRRTMERDHHAAVKGRTPEDWSVEESKHFLVVSHADPKFTKQMVEGAELFYAWCEKEFSTLGDDYVRRSVLRLCKDRDEYYAFHFDSSNSTGWSLFGSEHEIGTYYDTYNGTSGRDVSRLFGGILTHYLQELDPHIVSYTPYWLTWALDDYVEECYVKGRKLDFRVEDWARDEARDMAREDKLPKLHDILAMSESDFSKLRKDDSRAKYAASQALRFVLGPGSREKVFKDFLLRYFKAAIAVAEKHDADWKSADHTPAETEEEEERQAKEYAKRTKERAKQVQAEINEMVLGQITDKQWEKFDKNFADFVKKGK
ncbi:MAG: hypothetical protein KDC98_10305 [Planctomycetes bacterium]|nr:hypothetical protein [Planctomycetota bacterium]